MKTLKDEDIEYRDGKDNTLCRGHAFYPECSGKRPAILVVSEWDGVDSKHPLLRAKMLAKELSYVAFVADIYGKDIRPPAGDDDACARQPESISRTESSCVVVDDEMQAGGDPL